jgi:hypothetical protein
LRFEIFGFEKPAVVFAIVILLIVVLAWFLRVWPDIAGLV